MNYLYQASHKIVNKNLPLASHLSSLMVGCAKKAVLRMEPAVKRTICKHCQSPLIPGKTARVRLVSKPAKAIKWTCLACGENRKIPTKKGHKLWWDQPEAVKCILDFSPKVTDSSKFLKTQKESMPAEKGKQEVDDRELNNKETNEKINLEKL
ncbi:ribonuclease P protein subunit p21 isoform X2 [Leptopilina heterotoma]|nr:ribonuclease P protein subunit p21 isoform X2 [Leptopilina heterotoma]